MAAAIWPNVPGIGVGLLNYISAPQSSRWTVLMLPIPEFGGFLLPETEM